MTRMTRGVLIASILILIAITASACTMPYSQQPVATITAAPKFTTPLAGTDPMQAVVNAATGTAQSTPGAASPTSIVVTATPQVGVATATPQVVIPATATPTSTITVATATIALPPAGNTGGSNPSTYTLHAGEFPYCIARRFNVDPDELLALNGLVDSQTVFPGKLLNIPQSGNLFPGTRVLHNHPDTYTVDSSDETIYGVACYYGDIDPSRIAQANNLPVTAALTAGQRLTIP